ncbi:MAG: hypothetical protein ABI550_00555 [Ignavibacteriaceae bacterium]
MSFRDQQKLLDELRKYERKFDKKEAEEYKMFLKRQKDDEDFDLLSMSRLKELYDKYHTDVDKTKFDSFFRKNP